MTTIWALTDHRPGTSNQVMGIAKRLPYSLIEHELHYSKAAKLPNALLSPFGLMALTSVSKTRISAPWPDLVISAGRRAATVALYIKKQHPHVKLVHLMKPRVSARHFDLLVLPRHDKPAMDGNIMTTLGAPNMITESILSKARVRSPIDAERFPRPWVLLCLGGNSSYGAFTVADIERMTEQLHPFSKEGGTMFASASRRTPPALLGAFEDRVRMKCPMMTLELYAPSHTGDNPYHAWLSQADSIIVTADSVSMISEAAFTDKPLYTFIPEKAAGAKHIAFLTELLKEGYVRELDAYDASWTQSSRLNEAERVVEAIRRLMKGLPISQ